MARSFVSDRNTKQLITLGSLARRCDVPAMRLSRLLQAGELVPDFTAGPAKLFHPERVEEIRARLNSSQPTA